MRRRDLAVAAGVALLVAGLTQVLFAPRLAGVSIDLLFLLRQTFLPVDVDPQKAQVVVVALDEESQHRPPFSELPHVMWTPQIGKVRWRRPMIMPSEVSAEISSSRGNVLRSTMSEW